MKELGIDLTGYEKVGSGYMGTCIKTGKLMNWDTYKKEGLFIDDYKRVGNIKDGQEDFSSINGRGVGAIIIFIGILGYMAWDYLADRKKISRIPEVSMFNKQVETSIQDIISGNFSIDGKSFRLQIRNPSDITNQIEVAECGISQDNKVTNITYTLPNKYWNNGFKNPLQNIGIENHEFDKKIKEENDTYKEKVGTNIESFSRHIGEKLQCPNGYTIAYSMNDYRRTSKTSGYYHQVPVSSNQAGLTKIKCN